MCLSRIMLCEWNMCIMYSTHVTHIINHVTRIKKKRVNLCRGLWIMSTVWSQLYTVNRIMPIVYDQPYGITFGSINLGMNLLKRLRKSADFLSTRLTQYFFEFKYKIKYTLYIKRCYGNRTILVLVLVLLLQ